MADEITTLMIKNKNKKLLLRLRNTKTVTGILKDFDIHMNLSLDDAEEEYIAKCTHEANPNRAKINKDVVGLVKKTYTRKTKTTKECRNEFYATQ